MTFVSGDPSYGFGKEEISVFKGEESVQHGLSEDDGCKSNG